MKFVCCIICIALFSVNRAHAQVPAQAVPDFTFFRLDKTRFTNKDLPAGKMLFFMFFDSDCEHCQHAVQHLSQEFKDYEKAAVYLITLDSQEKINNFLNVYGPNLKGQKNVLLLQDALNQFIVRFLPRKYPSMFLYSPCKKLIDYEDNEESMFRFVKPINAAQNSIVK
jgi:peroxiredoxin